MKTTMGGNKGFTLIEILIVVVVIGILASLLMPRMLSAPEKALAAEANMMLGTMIRAQQANIDTGGVFATITANTSSSEWARLGMRTPGAAVSSGVGAKFTYTCSSSQCAAERTGATNKRATITSAGVWSCGSDYTTMTNGGCTLL